MSRRLRGRSESRRSRCGPDQRAFPVRPGTAGRRVSPPPGLGFDALSGFGPDHARPLLSSAHADGPGPGACIEARRSPRIEKQRQRRNPPDPVAGGTAIRQWRNPDIGMSLSTDTYSHAPGRQVPRPAHFLSENILGGRAAHGAAPGGRRPPAPTPAAPQPRFSRSSRARTLSPCA